MREKTRTPQTHNSPLSLSKQNLCRKRPCWNNGTCQAGFTDKDFRCICPVGVRGERCRKGKSTNEDGLPGLSFPLLENFTTSSLFSINKFYCLPCQRTSYYYNRDISPTLTLNNHVALFPPNPWEALNRGFARQPCCMAGTMKVFRIRKITFPHRKKSLLFLPCNMAAVQNLYKHFNYS